jgi:hypothetical protein
MIKVEDAMQIIVFIAMFAAISASALAGEATVSTGNEVTPGEGSVGFETGFNDVSTHLNIHGTSPARVTHSGTNLQSGEVVQGGTLDREDSGSTTGVDNKNR